MTTVGGAERAGRLGVPPLPRGRAVAGGALVALSAVGLLAAHRAATTSDLHSYLVVRDAVVAGERIDAADLALAPMDLDPSTAPRAFRSGDLVVGRTARTDLVPGELVQRSDVGRPAATGPARRLGLLLPPERALGGDVDDGDRIDVVRASAEDAVVVAAGALVRAVATEPGTLGSSADVRLTIVVADETQAAAVLSAAAAGEVALTAAAPAAEATDG